MGFAWAVRIATLANGGIRKGAPLKYHYVIRLTCRSVENVVLK